MAPGLYLQRNSLDEVPLWVLMVGAALYRDRKGFPASYHDIGTAQDKGDLFLGNYVMGECGFMKSTDNGLRPYQIDLHLPKDCKKQFFAGAPREKSKS